MSKVLKSSLIQQLSRPFTPPRSNRLSSRSLEMSSPATIYGQPDSSRVGTLWSGSLGEVVASHLFADSNKIVNNEIDIPSGPAGSGRDDDRTDSTEVT